MAEKEERGRVMISKIQVKNGHKKINLNRRTVIRERCLNCSGWIPKEVTYCELLKCPLYPFRTGRGKQDSKQRFKAIRQYCLWCTVGQRKEVTLCPSRDCPLYSYRKGGLDKLSRIDSTVKKHHIEASI